MAVFNNLQKSLLFEKSRKKIFKGYWLDNS